MGYINKKNKVGAVAENAAPYLQEGELGIDLNAANGDVGRIYVGTGSQNVALAKKAEVDGKLGITAKAADSSLLDGLDSTAFVLVSTKGVANGVATLDAAGLVPTTQLPAYVGGDILEFANLAGFPVTGVAGKIYVALDTNKIYRWSGSAYTYITSGAVDSVNGQTGVVNITTITGNSATATTATNVSGGTVNATTGTFSGELATATQIVIGTGGDNRRGSIYSDPNWGMLFRAKVDTPNAAHFVWMKGDGSELFRHNGIALTTNITGNATTATTAGSCTGNSATATKLTSSQGDWSASGVLSNVVGMLAWKNYGNGHIIFDASNGTAPNGAAVNNTNSTVPWNPTFPTLMGWNGSSTHGLRVDSARVADSTTYASAFTTAVGSAPSYACRAWVNFNGTGTVAIRASGNVSSITDNGVGDYTVNFTTAMPDGNYSVVGIGTRDVNNAPSMVTPYILGVQGVANFRYTSRRVDNAAVDGAVQCISIFR